MQLTAANYGEEPANAVTATIVQDGHKLPAVQFEEIAPGDSVTRRFRATFAASGDHQLQATLESDAVEIDNARYFACTIPTEFPILLIDGSRDGDDGYYLRTALSPGGNSKPGWNPQVQRPEFLRQHEQFDKLPPSACSTCRDSTSRKSLRWDYVAKGGGLGILPRTARATAFLQRAIVP